MAGCWYFSAVIFSFLLVLEGCANHSSIAESSYTYAPATAEIKQSALYYARLYQEADTRYLWGGQDALRTVYIDCSGLVYRCYQYAIEDTEYEMIEPDMSSAYMAANCYPTEAPEEGDLIFMGESNSASVTHIAIYVKEADGLIYFIDSTLKDDIDGVSERSYGKEDARFKGFGIMKLRIRTDG